MKNYLKAIESGFRIMKGQGLKSQLKLAWGFLVVEYEICTNQLWKYSK